MQRPINMTDTSIPKQIEGLNAIVQEYDLSNDQKVKPAHRTEFLGVLMLRAAQHSNILLMDNAYYHQNRQPDENNADYFRLACAAWGLVSKQKDLVVHLLEKIPDYSHTAAFSALLNVAAETTDLSLFDRAFEYVKDNHIPLPSVKFDFMHLLAARNEAERLVNAHNCMQFTRPEYLTVGKFAFCNNAKDVVEKFVLNFNFDEEVYHYWMEVCAELESNPRFEMSKLVVDSVPSPKRHDFIVQYIQVTKYAPENFLNLTRDLAAHCEHFTPQQKNKLIKDLQDMTANPNAQELATLLGDQRLNKHLHTQINTVRSGKTSLTRKI